MGFSHFAVALFLMGQNRDCLTVPEPLCGGPCGRFSVEKLQRCLFLYITIRIPRWPLRVGWQNEWGWSVGGVASLQGFKAVHWFLWLNTTTTRWVGFTAGRGLRPSGPRRNEGSSPVPGAQAPLVLLLLYSNLNPRQVVGPYEQRE